MGVLLGSVGLRFARGGGGAEEWFSQKIAGGVGHVRPIGGGVFFIIYTVWELFLELG